MFFIEFGVGIENVFISPLFLKLDTPEPFDSIIWLIPTLIDIAIYPIMLVFL